MGELTKWPRLLVVGDPVTQEQANEILVRTDDWYFSTNDRQWEDALTRLAIEFGMPRQPAKADDWDAEATGHRSYWLARKAWTESLGVLDLSYIHNDRIVSAWIGGPHGWCDWDGTIGCDSWNVGKWPSVEEVTEDWTAIARAFPYLNLKAQLVPDEGEAGVPAVGWTIADGTVTTDAAPTELLTTPRELSEGAILGRFLFADAERGVSLARLRQALAQVGRVVSIDETGWAMVDRGSWGQFGHRVERLRRVQDEQSTVDDPLASHWPPALNTADTADTADRHSGRSPA